MKLQMSLFSLILVALVATTGCTKPGAGFDYYSDEPVSSDFAMLSSSDFAAQLGLKLASDSPARIKFTNKVNSVVIYKSSRPELVVNGKTLHCEVEIMRVNGKTLISSKLIRPISCAMKSLPRKTDREKISNPKPPVDKDKKKIDKVKKPNRGKIWLKTRPVVVIDAGHGGHDPGAIRPLGSRHDRRRKLASNQEKTVVLDIALKLEKKLKAAGCRVIMTRRTDKFIPLRTRAAISNRAKPKLFISIHADAARSRSASGHTIYYPRRLGTTGRSYKVGKSIDRELRKITHSTRKMRQHTKRLVVLEQTRSSALLVEVGFMSNSAEARKLVNSWYRTKLANAISSGIVKSFKKAGF